MRLLRAWSASWRDIGVFLDAALADVDTDEPERHLTLPDGATTTQRWTPGDDAAYRHYYERTQA